MRPALTAIWATAVVAGLWGQAVAAPPAANPRLPRSSAETDQRLEVVEDAAPPFEGHPVPAESRQTDEIAVKVLERGSSSASAKEAALAALPLAKLDVEQRKVVDGVLDSQALFRRLPKVCIDTDRAVYDFFVAHPDVAVSIWRVMKISQVEMWQTGRDEYEADAGDGSLGVLQVLYRGDQQQLIVCDGVFKTPVLPKPIRGRALLHLKTDYATGDKGESLVTHSADLFVAFPSVTVETAAKIISPVSHMLADRNFREISLFIRMMSLAMQNQPGWVERVSDRMEGVLPVRKTQLLKLTAQVFVDARKRELAARGEQPGEITFEEVMRPLRAAQRSAPVDRIATKPEE